MNSTHVCKGAYTQTHTHTYIFIYRVYETDQTQAQYFGHLFGVWFAGCLCVGICTIFIGYFYGILFVVFFSYCWPFMVVLCL